MKKQNQFAVRPKVVLPVALFALILMGGSLLLSRNSELAFVVTDRLGITNTAAVASASLSRTFSYTNLDKGFDGEGVQNIKTQTPGLPIGISLSSNKKEIALLKKYTKGGPLAYVSYDVYPAHVTRNGGAVGVQPIFSSVGEISLKANATEDAFVGSIPLQFTSNLLPDQMYTLRLKVRAANSGFNVDDYIHLNIENTAQCKLKG